MLTGIFSLLVILSCGHTILMWNLRTVANVLSICVIVFAFLRLWTGLIFEIQASWVPLIRDVSLGSNDIREALYKAMKSLEILLVQRETSWKIALGSATKKTNGKRFLYQQISGWETLKTRIFVTNIPTHWYHLKSVTFFVTEIYILKKCQKMYCAILNFESIMTKSSNWPEWLKHETLFAIYASTKIETSKKLSLNPWFKLKLMFWKKVKNICTLNKISCVVITDNFSVSAIAISN